MALLHYGINLQKNKTHFSLMHCPQSVYAHHLKTHLPRSLSPYLSLSLNSRLKSLASWHYDYNNFECNGFDICTQNTPHTVKKQRTMHTLLLLYFAQHTTLPPRNNNPHSEFIIRNYVLQQRTILYFIFKAVI